MPRIKTIREITPVKSRCIEVSSNNRLFTSGTEGNEMISHNSVVQRNIIFGAIMRPDRWRFLGIDLKRVELSAFRAYSNVVLGIATTLEDALTVLRFAQQTMMKRYTEMEELGINNFLDLPEAGQALMVMVDEMGELLSDSGKAVTDEQKEEALLRGEASAIIGSIARLGRAAGVHLVDATQRPDASIIAGETKANHPVRINCGRTNPTASSMILDNGEGARVKPKPRGRLYLQVHGQGNHGQGFFAPQDWIDEYLASIGKNPDGTPLSSQKKSLATISDMSQFENADLDAKEGVDNSTVIQKLREQDEMIDSGSIDIVEEETANQSSDSSSLERPTLGGGTGKDKFHRPEDDWDDDLDALIAENDREIGK